MKLLVVEDERMLCDTIAKSLHHAGYEVDCCYDGAEALERLLIEQYDLIVLDLHLPGPHHFHPCHICHNQSERRCS